MPREVSERLAAMLDGSRQVTYEANVVRGDESMDGLPVELGGGLSWDAGQQVEFSGTVNAVLVDEAGRSYAPTSVGDLFAPFGSEVMLSARVAVADMVERVQLARARITAVPKVLGDRVNIGGEWVTLSETITLELRDRMDVLKADKFDTDTRVRYATSAWRELEHLCPFPVLRSGADAALPKSLSYPKDKTRADAVQTIAGRLGGVAAFDSLGNLIVRRASSASVLDLRLGRDGTVASVGSAMDTDGIYNRVVVRGKQPNGAPIQVERTATGELSPAVWGRRTYVADQGDFLGTRAQAALYAERLLASVSTLPKAELQVQCLMDPRLEVGDVASVTREGKSERLRVSRINYGDPMMTVLGRLL